MVVRAPGILTLSMNRNLGPKLDYSVREIKGDLEEFKKFPQFFSFSLERKIKPRHRMLVEYGLKMPLSRMLKVNEGEFNARLFEMLLRMVEESVGRISSSGFKPITTVRNSQVNKKVLLFCPNSRNSSVQLSCYSLLPAFLETLVSGICLHILHQFSMYQSNRMNSCDHEQYVVDTSLKYLVWIWDVSGQAQFLKEDLKHKWVLADHLLVPIYCSLNTGCSMDARMAYLVHCPLVGGASALQQFKATCLKNLLSLIILSSPRRILCCQVTHHVRSGAKTKIKENGFRVWKELVHGRMETSMALQVTDHLIFGGLHRTVEAHINRAEKGYLTQVAFTFGLFNCFLVLPPSFHAYGHALVDEVATNLGQVPCSCINVDIADPGGVYSSAENCPNSFSYRKDILARA
ncbi:hypothetical protein D5086_016160 [Populus alba]|uniref:Uncharacterized protein n=1 Tax=Populus alba TaxID=43335 RepID=A0ACC4BT81_POPAL